MDNPLVSICITYRNAERYLARAIDSCLNQTYKNIEVVLVDDASTDRSEEIVKKYQDKRISYYRLPNNIGLAESELTMFEKAKGELCMMLGADDFLNTHYIEEGIIAFENFPTIAGAIPQLVSLQEEPNGTLNELNRTHDFRVCPTISFKEHFMENLYKPKHLYVSAFALVRTKDYREAMRYYLENYYWNLPADASAELVHYRRMAFGMDGVVFPYILMKYEIFAFVSGMQYHKVALYGGQANPLDLKRDSIKGILKEYRYLLDIYSMVYKDLWPQYYRRMRLYRLYDLAKNLVKHPIKKLL